MPAKIVIGVSTSRSLVLELVRTTSMSLVGSTLTRTSPKLEVPSLIVAGRTTLTVGTRKLLVLVAKPEGVETEIGPLKAPAGTVALRVVSVTLEKDAATPLKATLVAPVKLDPPMVTAVPAAPDTGLKVVMTGGVPLDDVDVTRRSSMLIFGRLPVFPAVGPL